MLLGRFLAHEILTGKTRDEVVSQFEECNHHINKLRNKARLLLSQIGRDGRTHQAAASLWETLNILQEEEVDRGKEEIKTTWEGLEEICNASQKEEVLAMGKNLGKLAQKACKRLMGAINSRLIPMESKMHQMSSEDGTTDNQFDFNSVSSANIHADVGGRLWRIQDRARVLEEDFRTQGGSSGNPSWGRGTQNANPGGGTLTFPS
jgi:hypothetical protein